ncbi:MAG TPA: hypothetical protein VMR97_14125 [Acidimicrobiales bacterium]|nr:hypothetical protein [Acidimicrobiales bacterium]
MVLSFGEPYRRACDEIDDGTGHQHLSRTGQTTHALCNVDGDPTYVLATAFHLACVQPDSNIEA